VEVVGIYLPGRGTRLSRPLVEWRVPAGFPGPAQDEIAGRIDLNRDLVKHPLATFYVRVEGDSQEFTPDVGVYSIDEAFLGLDERPRQSFPDYGLEIRAKVYKWTGVSCSLGISRTKTPAKVAQHFTKKHPEAQGVLDLMNLSDRVAVYSTDSTEELLTWALRGLEQIYRAGYRYKKTGVMLNRLAPAEQLSMRLFGEERFEKSRRVMEAVDEINARHGRDTIRFGAAPTGGRWETKFLRRSRRYTTRLDEILKVA
jgi:hypothetical protein